ncbi:hypothetical protein OS493_040369, partial [Desmophyllum pertusum]
RQCGMKCRFRNAKWKRELMSETQIEVGSMEGVVTEVLVSQSEDENGNGIDTENEVDTMQRKQCNRINGCANVR